ncbi:NAD(P) transhydrogenase subunit alpha [Actinopolymorpha rutila]|uniref:proton-translocating NAD(P)(+) transhydrogenase n=1 Tax=Actinopolymorpha rutila TaxID=446787 RepID=A0A852ZUS3_9ACTN|nr:NAD(P) transhydrogenase subunit alpha [Actinopolymorpha rutila]
MRIAVLRERRTGERRVALLPEQLPRLLAAGVEVSVESGAGNEAGATDDDYRAVGAQVSEEVLTGADIVVSVQPINLSTARQLGEGVVTVSFLPTAEEGPLVRRLRERRITSFSMDLVPRTARAQPMDALSSQSMVAGYRGAIVAAERLQRFFPLFMTAAGTVRPATVLVLGAGVAGLQAIATVRRLGAVVEAYDVRESSAEEVASVGAKFVQLGLPPLAGAGGYAREMTEERATRQRELLAPHVAAADVLITTAAVPGRTAPVLVTTDMVAAMRAGSVVVDLAADQGGNVEGSIPGHEVMVEGVLVWGGSNVASQLPRPASELYGHNVVNVLLLMVRVGVLHLDFGDDILSATCVTHAGEVVHRPTLELLGEVG